MLIVVATEKEAADLEKKIAQSTIHEVDFLVTGVGMTATTYALTKKLSKKRYHLALNIGLAGTFREEIRIGEVVNIVTDCFADLGAEDGEKFLTLTQLGLQNPDKFPFWNGKLKSDEWENYSSLKTLKHVKGITVNKVHGHDESIQRSIRKFHPDVESMEGAAFFYVCMMEKVPSVQLRAISNRVERRNPSTWNMDLSLQNLNGVIMRFMEDFADMSSQKASSGGV